MNAMKTLMTLALVLSTAGFAAAQEERDRRLDELKRDHDRRMQELQKRFDEDRTRLESEFRRRMEEPRKAEGQRPSGSLEEQVRRLTEQVERLTQEVEHLKQGGRPGGDRPAQVRPPMPPVPPRPEFRERRPEPPQPPQPPRERND
jgi:hypothetical protein